MTEMQIYYPIPEPVSAWQWDGLTGTTMRMLKKWGESVKYYPATPKHSLMSSKVTVEPHHLMVKRLPNNTWTRVNEGDYVVQNSYGLWVSSRERFERKHQTAGPNQYPDISRIEVIEDSQRGYVKYGFAGAGVAIQDEGRTMKIFASVKKQLPDFTKIAEALCQAKTVVGPEGCEYCGMSEDFHQKNDGCW